MKKNYLISKCLAPALILISLFIICAPAAALPNTGVIAILAAGSSEQQAASVTSIMAREFIAKGYRVAAPDALAAIRRHSEASAALEGNANAIKKLSEQYGFGSIITAQIEAGSPVQNEFKLYTGASSIALMAMNSDGEVIYADTVMGRQVGYTPLEAAQKSMEADAMSAVQRML